MSADPLLTYAIRDGLTGWLARGISDDELRELDDDELRASPSGETVFVASTADEDRMGDVVLQDWRLGNYRRNPVILADHDSRHVVGRASYVGVPKALGSLVIRVAWDDAAALNPTGALLAHQHRNGFRKAGSVGFRPGESKARASLPKDDPHYREPKAGEWFAGSVLSRNELLEFSSVSVPANASAIQLAAHARTKSDDVSEQIASVLRECLPAQVRAELLAAIRKDDGVRRAIAAIALSLPESDGRGTRDPLSHLWGDAPRRSTT